MWQNVDILDVQQLPYDIDGLVAFRLAFDPKQIMQSSKDGRHWATWVTSNRKGFKGIRRSTCCDGGYSCENSNCIFLSMYKKKNRLQFEDDESGFTSCSSCGMHAKKVFCTAQKIWEFEKEEHYVTVYHNGIHTCEARKTVDKNEEGLKKKFEANSKTTPRQAADDIIIETLVNENISWEDVRNTVDSVIEEKRVRYCKKKTEKESHPCGHSFEAVGELRSRLLDKDPFLIYKVNNRNLNGEPSYVFKTSKVQAQLAVAMDRDGDNFLSDECCFFFLTGPLNDALGSLPLQHMFMWNFYEK